MPHVCSFYHDDTTLTPAFREALEEALFAQFLSPESEPEIRKRLPSDAPPDEPVSRTISRLCRLSTFTHVTAKNRELTEKVSHDAIHWCANRWARAQEHTSFEKTEAEITRLEGYTARRPQPLLEAAETLSISFPALGDSLRFFADKARRLAAEAAEATGTEAGVLQAEAEALRRKMKASLEAALASERQRQFERVLGASLPSYVQKLNAEVPALAEAQARIRDFFGTSRRAWDLLGSAWQKIRWDSLEEVAAGLDSDDTLTELADMLGRGDFRQAAMAHPRTRQVTETVWEETSAGRSEVTGVRQSGELEGLLSSEIGLLAFPETETLFTRRFAEGELLSLQYRTREVVSRTRSRTERVPGPGPNQRGPAILCVDTSGSMIGEPERVAKRITFALARSVLETGRRCYLIAFSTEIITVELSSLAEALAPLSEFLSGSFRGGTDIRPALRQTLAMLNESAYRDADVVVVSDFRMPKIMDRSISSIQTHQHDRGTRFHSLTVARQEVEDPLHIFDYHWHYDISQPRGKGITALLARRLHSRKLQ